MAEERLTVIYDGTAVGGRIAVRDLAPSLLALADLVQEMQATLYPDDPRVAVDIIANREGSFEVDLEIVHTLFEQARSLLTGDSTNAAVNLMALGSALLGAIKLVKALHGRRIARREEREGQVRLHLEDGTVLTTTPEVILVYDRTAVRRLMRDFFHPLRRDGMESIRVEHRDDDVTVTREDRAAFELDPEDEVLSDSTTELVMRIASLQFGPGNKWRLTDGSNNYWVTLDDPAFVDDIARNAARFGMHDLLHVRLRTIQYRDPEGNLRTEHHAEKITHLPAQSTDQPTLEP